jgi:hypothetical protein
MILKSRFRRLHLSPYTEEQFLEVLVMVLPKLKIAHVIGKEVGTREEIFAMLFQFGSWYEKMTALNKLSRYLVR